MTFLITEYGHSFHKTKYTDTTTDDTAHNTRITDTKNKYPNS